MNNVHEQWSKQFTESKTRLGALGAHLEPKLRAHCAQALRTTLCRGAHWAVSWRTRDHVVAPSRSCRRSSMPCRYAHAYTVERHVAGSSAVSQHRPGLSQHCIATRPTAKPSSCHDTSDCIVTLSLARLPACHDAKTLS